MDYEKKYKEALERAKQVYKTPYTAHWDVMKELIEYLFSELKESDDERIREWIIDDIRYNMNNEPLNNSEYKMNAEKAIAWFEKAVTPTPQDWNDHKDKPVEVWNAYVKGIANGIERGKQAVKNHPQDYGLEKQSEKEKFIEKELGCIRGYREEALRRLQELEKQGEEKPSEEYSITGIGSKHAEGKLGEMIKNLKPVNEVLEQKPAWSAEDEERYLSCLKRLGTGDIRQPETINTVWLKSLKDRIK